MRNTTLLFKFLPFSSWFFWLVQSCFILYYIIFATNYCLLFFLLLLPWCFILLLHCLCYKVLPSVLYCYDIVVLTAFTLFTASKYSLLFLSPITFLFICDQLVSFLWSFCSYLVVFCDACQCGP